MQHSLKLDYKIDITLSERDVIHPICLSGEYCSSKLTSGTSKIQVLTSYHTYTLVISITDFRTLLQINCRLRL